jgi:phenylalanyl-tRNA synthetase alpha subunit
MKDFYELKRMSEQRKKDKEKQYLEDSRERLANIIETKIRTSFIASLARFEEEFGHLWGHTKQELTDQEKEWRLVWEEVRKSILNTGNNQIRNMRKEMDYYSIKWNRFQLTMPFKPREK